jgi:Alpha-kinase family
MFADAFLEQEKQDKEPSVASGGRFNMERIMWLIEKRRPTTVTRYSGTLLHPSNKKDLQSLTIFAFVHFVFGHSNKQMVFADLQGMSSKLF